MNNLIEERDERTRRRKRKKRKMDSIIGLSYHDKDKHVMNLSVSNMGDETIRLLDEGYCDQGFVIKKGTLAKYLNGENQYVRGYEMGDDGEWETTDVLNLTDDFEGTVNVGHQDFATYPIIVGKWNRSDLSLVDIENDRKGLDVALDINEELHVVQDLKAMPYDIGVSAEFYYHVNDDDTEALFETFGEYIPVIDEIFIFAYGLVGECGNVNSSGLELKGATMSKPKMEDMATPEVEIEVTGKDEAIEKIEELAAFEDEEAPEDVEESDDAEETEESESADEDVSEEPVSEEEEDTEEEPEEEDESKEGEVDDVEEEIDNEDEAEEAELSFDDLMEQFSMLKEEVERLKDIEAKYVALKKSHRRVNRKLAEEKEAKAEFFAKTKNLSAELFENEGEAAKEEEAEAKRAESEKKYYKGDGIAD